jgi:hypothetical protein
MATHCRFLAASCITDAAKRPLTEMADELERAADIEPSRMRSLIGCGRC